MIIKNTKLKKFLVFLAVLVAGVFFTALSCKDEVYLSIYAEENNGNSPVQLKYIEGADIPLYEPSKIGHTFDGWFLERALETPVDKSSKIADGGYIFAKWLVNQYTISFESPLGSEVLDITQDFGTQIEEMPQSFRTGYTIAGWLKDKDDPLSLVSFPYTLGAESITLYAVWEINEYTVSLRETNDDLITGATDIKADYQSEIERPNAHKTGHSLRNWYFDKAKTLLVEFPYTVLDDVVFYADWEVLKYTIRFDAGTDAVFEGTENSYVDVIKDYYTFIPFADFPVPTREGYDFQYWRSGNKSYNYLDYQVLADATLTAEWKIKTFDIAFFDADGISPLETENGDAIVPLKKNWGTTLTMEELTDQSVQPFIYGFTFLGWLLDGNEAQPIIGDGYRITGALTFIASWERRNFVLSFNMNTNDEETAIPSVIRPFEDIITETDNLIPDGEKSGHTFIKWYYLDSENEKIDFTLPFVFDKDLVLQPEFTINSYTVTFKYRGGSKNGGEDSYTKPYKTILAIADCPKPTRSGYEFGGWYETLDGSVLLDSEEIIESGEYQNARLVYDGVQGSHPTYEIRKDIILYAYWPLSKDCRILNMGDFTTPTDQLPQSTGTATLRVSNAKTSIDLIAEAWDKMIISDGAKAEMFFDYQDGVLKNPIDETEPASLSLNEGNNNFYILITAANQGYTRIYTVTIYRNRIFTLTLVLNNGDLEGNASDAPVSIPVEEGDSLNKTAIDGYMPPASLLKKGYNFSGIWYTSPSDHSDGTNWFRKETAQQIMPAGNLTLYAGWTQIKYTIYLRVNFTGGTNQQVNEKTYGGNLNGLTTPSRSGYTFSGWYTMTGGEYNQVTNTYVGGTTLKKYEAADQYLFNENLYLYASWTANKYKISFVYKGSPGNPINSYTDITNDTIKSIDIYYDSPYGVLPAPIRVGYDFRGWIVAADFSNLSNAMPKAQSDIYRIENDQTLYAWWEAKTRTITYYDDDGTQYTGLSADVSTFKFDQAVSVYTPNKKGHEFLGWKDINGNDYTDGTPYRNGDPFIVDWDIELYAKWQAKTYTISYASQGRTGISSRTIVYGTALTSDYDELPGYVKGNSFGGWRYKNVIFAFGNNELFTEFAEDVALVAIWTPNTYNITFVFNPDASGDDILDSRIVISGNTSENNYISPYNEKTVVYGTAIGVLPSFERNGYIFKGWYYGEIESGVLVWRYNGTGTDAFSYGLLYEEFEENITLYAKWEQKQYKVVYEYNTEKNIVGNDIKEFYVYYDNPLGTLQAPDRKGYEWNGWFNSASFDISAVFYDTILNDDMFSYIDASTTEVRIYSKWTAYDYILTYHANGADGYNGSDPMPTSFTITFDKKPSEMPDTFVLPTKTGFKFAGWYTIDGGSGVYVALDVIYEENQNYDIYAHWYSDCLDYTENADSVEIKRGSPWNATSLTGEIFLPAMINGKPVASMQASLFEGCSNITRVHIGEYSSIIILPNNAFKGCTSLKEIDLPPSLTRINLNVFQNCTSLESIVFLENLKEIGSEAFLNCTSLKTVNFTHATALTSIGTSAFQKCSAIKSLVLPASLTNMNVSAFANCTALESVEFLNSPTVLSSNLFYECTALKYVINIPASVTKIDTAAFMNCKNIEEIALPISLTEIAQNAFNNCIALNKVSFAGGGASLKRIGSGAFEGCGELKYFNNDYEGVFVLPVNLADTAGTPYTYGLGANAFKGNKNLKSISIPLGIKRIADSTFEACENLSNITFSALDLTQIGSKAFYDCVSLSNVSLPSNVSILGASAFEGCTALEIIDLQSNLNMTKLPSRAFFNCTSLTNVLFPRNVQTIDESAFEGCTVLTTADMSGLGNLQSIGSRAFYNCVKLEEVSLTGSVHTINSQAFTNNKSLRSVTLSEGLKAIASDAFSACSVLDRIVIPASVTDIGTSVFIECDELLSVEFLGATPPTLGAGSTDANNRPFSLDIVLIVPKQSGNDNPLTAYTAGNYSGYNVQPDFVYVNKTDGFVYMVTKDSESSGRVAELLRYTGTLSDLAVYETFYDLDTDTNVNLTVVGKNAFKDNKILTNVSLPTYVREIQASAFEGCDKITNVSLTTGSFANLRYINERAFYGCKALTHIYIPESLILMRDYAFAECNVLTTVVIMNNSATLTAGGFGAFSGTADGLKIYVAENEMNAYKNAKCASPSSSHTCSVGACGFSAYSARINSRNQLSDNYIVEPLAGYEQSLLAIRLKSYIGTDTAVVVPEKIGNQTVKELGANLFSATVLSVHIHGGIEKIDANAFGIAANLTEITVDSANANYMSIDGILYTKDASGNALTIVHVPKMLAGARVIPKTIKEIPASAFRDRALITSITFYEDSVLERINNSAFSGCSSLEDFRVYIQGSTSSWLNDGPDPSITYQAAPDSLTFVGKDAFTGTAWLNNHPNNTMVYVGKVAYRFKGTVSGAFSFRSGTHGIGEYAFEGQTALSSVVILPAIALIPNGAFFGCTNLGVVDFFDEASSMAVEIGVSAFQNCSSLYSINIPGLNTSGGGIRIIGTDAFNACVNLVNIDMPRSITAIGTRAFFGCIRLNKLYIPDRTDMAQVVPVSLGVNILTGCSGLTELTVSGRYKLQYLFGDNLNNIPATLTTIRIDGNLINNYIDTAAFLNCSTITTFIVEDNTQLVMIKRQALHGTAWYKNYANPAVYLGKIFYSYKGTMGTGASFSINDGTIGIADQAMYYHTADGLTTDCRNLETLFIPSSVRSIGSNILAGTSKLKKLTIPGEIYTRDLFGEINGYPPNLKEVTISSGSNYVASLAFSGFASLEKVNIPKSITRIDDSAFKDCISLKEINFEKDGQLTDIGISTFSGCSSLNIMQILNDATYTGTAVSELSVPETVKNVGREAFFGCISLEQFVFYDSVQSIGENAFDYCPALNFVEILSLASLLSQNLDSAIPNNDTVIIVDASQKTAYEDLYKAKGYTIEVKGTYVGMMYDSATTPTWKFRFMVTEEGSGVYVGTYIKFYELVAPVTTLTMPANVPTIASRPALSGGSFKYAREGLFKGFKNFKKIVLPQSLTHISDSMFEGCESLITVEVFGTTPEVGATLSQITYIGDKAFSGARSLASFHLPNALTGIGVNVFEACQNLSFVRFDKHFTSLSDFESAFSKTLFVNVHSSFLAVVPMATADLIWENHHWGYLSGNSFVSKVRGYDLTNLTSNNFLVSSFVNGTDTEYRVEKFIGGGVDADVPATFNSKNITRLGAYSINGRVTKLKLEAQMKVIEENACRDAFSLATVDLATITKNASTGVESGLNSIGRNSFDNTALFNNNASGAGVWLDAGKTAFYTYKGTMPDKTSILATTPSAGELSLHTTRLIADYAFQNRTQLIVVNISSTLIYVGKFAFTGCTKITRFVVNSSNQFFTTRQDALYSKDMTSIVKFPAGSEYSQVVFLKGLKRIEADAFSDCINIKSLFTEERSNPPYDLPNLPDSLEYIGELAFYNCLSMVNTDDGANFRTLYIGQNVTTVGAEAFGNLNANARIYIFYNSSSLPAGWASNWIVNNNQWVGSYLNYEHYRTFISPNPGD